MAKNNALSRASLMQTATNAAATLCAALVTAGLLKDLDAVATEFASTRDSIFESLDEVAEAELGDSGGARPQPDPGTVAVNTGKHKGKTLSEIHAADPSYIIWLAFKGPNAWLAGRARAFLDIVDKGVEGAQEGAEEIVG